MFELFKLLEMFDGKIILGANELSPDEITYLAEYKTDLNDRILKETEERRREIDREMKSRNNPNRSETETDRERYEKIFGHVKKRQRL